MVLQELNESKFFIQEGVVYTLSPLTKLDKLEQEIRKEIESRLTISSGKETIIKMLGSAIEYFTENGWKVCFLKEDPNDIHLIIAAPFKGGVVKGKGTRENTKDKKYEIYVPSGYLGMEIRISEFPEISYSYIILLPNITQVDFKTLCKESKYRGAYRMVHPHLLSDYRLCSGLPALSKFDINMIVAQIEACIDGGNTKGSSILDYNQDSPATQIEDCVWGAKALEWHVAEKKTDEEIWKELMKHDRA